MTWLTRTVLAPTPVRCDAPSTAFVRAKNQRVVAVHAGKKKNVNNDDGVRSSSGSSGSAPFSGQPRKKTTSTTGATTGASGSKTTATSPTRAQESKQPATTVAPAYLHVQATRAGSFPTLAARNFRRELRNLVRDALPRRAPRPPGPRLGQSAAAAAPEGEEKQAAGGEGEGGEELLEEEMEMPECFGFTLDNEAIYRYDADHPAPGPAPVPAAVQVLYEILLFFVDRLYEGRAIERFWFLETVARMPYFAYTTCLHLYETMGWYRAPELRRWGGSARVVRSIAHDVCAAVALCLSERFSFSFLRRTKIAKKISASFLVIGLY